MNRPNFESGKFEAVVICGKSIIGSETTGNCGHVVLTSEEYMEQMMRASNFWQCPICGSEAIWDDDNFQDYCDAAEASRSGLPTTDSKGDDL